MHGVDYVIPCITILCFFDAPTREGIDTSSLLHIGVCFNKRITYLAVLAPFACLSLVLKLHVHRDNNSITKYSVGLHAWYCFDEALDFLFRYTTL